MNKCQMCGKPTYRGLVCGSCIIIERNNALVEDRPTKALQPLGVARRNLKLSHRASGH